MWIQIFIQECACTLSGNNVLFHTMTPIKQILFHISCVPYVADPENTTLLQTALLLFRKFNEYPQALRLAMQLNDHALIEEIFLSCKDT